MILGRKDRPLVFLATFTFSLYFKTLNRTLQLKNNLRLPEETVNLPNTELHNSNTKSFVEESNKTIDYLLLKDLKVKTNQNQKEISNKEIKRIESILEGYNEGNNNILNALKNKTNEQESKIVPNEEVQDLEIEDRKDKKRS